MEKHRLDYIRSWYVRAIRQVAFCVLGNSLDNWPTLCTNHHRGAQLGSPVLMPLWSWVTADHSWVTIPELPTSSFSNWVAVLHSVHPGTGRGLNGSDCAAIITE